MCLKSVHAEYVLNFLFALRYSRNLLLPHFIVFHQMKKKNNVITILLLIMSVAEIKNVKHHEGLYNIVHKN